MVRGNACSGNTAAHTAPLPTAALRQCLIGTFLHRQRFSDVQCFCAPCRFPCFPVAVGLAQRKPPFGGDTKEVQLGTFPGSYFRLVHSAPAPAHTPASRTTSDSLCGGNPCGRVSPAERVTAVMPGAVSLRPALTPGLRRESATSFRLTIGTEVLARSAALRCGVPVFTIEQICIVEVSTLRRPSGACRRDAACAVVFRFF